MDNLKLYEINANYITYLSAYAPNLFHNKKSGQKNERKYIGIVLHINGFDYFAPLSSFKDKHRLMKEGLDFIKIKESLINFINTIRQRRNISIIQLNINTVIIGLNITYRKRK